MSEQFTIAELEGMMGDPPPRDTVELLSQNDRLCRELIEARREVGMLRDALTDCRELIGAMEEVEELKQKLDAIVKTPPETPTEADDESK